MSADTIGGTIVIAATRIVTAGVETVRRCDAPTPAAAGRVGSICASVKCLAMAVLYAIQHGPPTNVPFISEHVALSVLMHMSAPPAGSVTRHAPISAPASTL